jgi:hypothetical protein
LVYGAGIKMKGCAMKTMTVLTCFLISFTSLWAGSPPVPVVNVVNEVRIPAVLDNPGGFYYVISPDGLTAQVILDASASSDPDNDPLQFWWGEFDEDSLHVFASGVRVTNEFSAESLRLGLAVSDGSTVVEREFIVVVATPARIVTSLIDIIKDDAMPGKAKRSLIAPLEEAFEDFERGDDEDALRALRVFLRKAKVQPASPDPARAMGVQTLTQVLIDTVSGK